jgi:SARP family transcriptional regulator, regulator of embCAB operon
MLGELAQPATARKRPKEGILRIQLLGSFQLFVEGRPLSLTQASERLVAFLGLSANPVQRLYAASRLWPDVMEDRALGNLRSTLWRLGQNPVLVESHGQQIRLVPAALDVQEVLSVARRLSHPGPEMLEADLQPQRFVGQLLPGWYDDWVVIERERLHQICQHALEAIARVLLQSKRHAEAIDAAWMAVAADPLRESAHQIIIETHAAEGNRGQAARHYTWCRELIAAELKTGPGRDLQRLGRTLLST